MQQSFSIGTRKLDFGKFSINLFLEEQNIEILPTVNRSSVNTFNTITLTPCVTERIGMELYIVTVKRN